MLRFISPGSTVDSVPAEDTPVRQVIRYRASPRARLQQHLHVTGALDDDVRLARAASPRSPGWIRGPEPADHLRLAALGDPVEHVGVVAALDDSSAASSPIGPAPVISTSSAPRSTCGRSSRCGPRPWPPRWPARAAPRGAEARVHRDQVLGVDAVALRGVAVPGLDARARCTGRCAHVPVPGGAGRARHGIGPAHDADHEVTGAEPGPRRRLDHPAQRLVADDQPVLAGRRRTRTRRRRSPGRCRRCRSPGSRPGRARRRGRLRHVGEGDRARLPGNDG